jgi:hypothetical protein
MLSDTVERYIALHLATGYLFRRQSGLLRSFARYAAARREVVVHARLLWSGRGSARRHLRATAGSRSCGGSRGSYTQRIGGTRSLPSAPSAVAGDDARPTSSRQRRSARCSKPQRLSVPAIRSALART